jgi:hypothetical protein
MVDIDGLIHRIVSGYYYITIKDIRYKIKSPNLKIRYRAHSIYNTIIENNKYNTNYWLSDNEIQSLLLFNNIWDNSKQKELDDQNKLLNQTKVNLFLDYSNEKKRKIYKETLIQINSHINNLYDQKYYFNFLSLDFYAKSIENQYIILNMVYRDNKKILVDQDMDDIDMDFFNGIIQEVQRNSIDMDTMKNIAKSQQWRNYWAAGKTKTLKGSSSSWTEEQLTLINLSQTYDSIREHMECPPEEIIQDNDALDGWMIHQNDKIEKEKKKQKIDDKYGLKNKKGDEVFILTDSVEETKEIFGLNTPENKHKINQIKEIGKQNKETKWIEVPFVQQELKQKQAAMGPPSKG